MHDHRKINRCTTTTTITTRNWADLPLELLEKIGDHLQSRLDVFRYRAVCSSWRYAVPLSHLTSSLTLNSSSSSFDEDNHQSSAFVSAVTICRLEDKHGSGACVVKLIETREGSFEVLHPLTIPNPNFIYGKTLDFTNCRLIELVQHNYYNMSIIQGELSIEKAIAYRDGGILAIYNDGKLGFRDSWDENWTELGDGNQRYDDMLVYQGEYYVIDRLGLIWWIDKSMNLVECLPQLSQAPMGQKKNLVESEGNLYVVDTYIDSPNITNEYGVIMWSRIEKVDVKVFQWDEEWGVWVQVTSLGDRVFIVGKEVSFSISVNDFPGCEGNCIYFLDSNDLEGEHIWLDFGPFLIPSYHITIDSLNLLRFHDSTLGYYLPRVFKLDDRSIRDVKGLPSLQRLFTPPKDCFCSTLSFP